MPLELVRGGRCSPPTKVILEEQEGFFFDEVVQLEWEQIFIDDRPFGREITKGKKGDRK
jgi:hypothetical protein